MIVGASAWRANDDGNQLDEAHSHAVEIPRLLERLGRASQARRAARRFPVTSRGSCPASIAHLKRMQRPPMYAALASGRLMRMSLSPLITVMLRSERELP